MNNDFESTEFKHRVVKQKITCCQSFDSEIQTIIKKIPAVKSSLPKYVNKFNNMALDDYLVI